MPLFRRQSHHVAPWIISSLVLFASAFLVSACTGLGGEPRIVSTLAVPTALPPDRGFPVVSPDLRVGQAIFEARCTRCHGVTGRGDGPLIGSGDGQIAQPPRDFTDRATIAGQSPQAWFETITNGRVEKLMPPWREALTENERWAVAMYTYAMSYSKSSLAQGEVLVAELGIDLSKLPDQSKAVTLTDRGLVELMSAGEPEWTDLTDEKIHSIASYLRTRLVEGSEVVGILPAQPQVTQEPSPLVTAEVAAEVVGRVIGTVTNRTSGATLPDGLKVTLNEVDEQTASNSRETEVGSDGSFAFEDVPIRSNRSYIVTTAYQDRTFYSEFVQGNPGTPELSLPVDIYELTRDPSVVQITGVVGQIIPGTDSVRVVEVISMSNLSDRAFTTDTKVDDTRYASVSIPVPADAVLLSIDSEDPRFVISSSPRAVTDTEPVLPGRDHIVHVVYSVPYSGERVFELAYGYTIAGQVQLLVPSGTLNVASTQLPALGQRTLGNAAYDVYGGELSLGAGEQIRFTLRGSAAPSAQSASLVASDQLLPVGLIVLGVSIVLLALVLYFRGRSDSVTGADAKQAVSKLVVDGLVREIAELDLSFETGALDEATYVKRRSRLKQRLAELIDED